MHCYGPHMHFSSINGKDRWGCTRKKIYLAPKNIGKGRQPCMRSEIESKILSSILCKLLPEALSWELYH